MASGTPIGTAFDQLAEENPDWPALTTDGVTFSRSNLSRRSSRLARALSNLGVRHGDLVTIALPNGVGFIETVLAVWKLGATPQPVSHRLPMAELSAVIELGRPRLIVGDPELENGPMRLHSGFVPATDLHDGPLPGRVAPSWKAPTSGGSTGRPKLILSTKPGVVESITGIADVVGMRNTPILMTGPLYHNGPLHYSAAALLLGTHLVLMTRFDAEEALRLVDLHRIGWMYVVPTMMRRMWALPPEQRDRYSLGSLHTMFHLAAPCPPWLKRVWIERLGPDAVVELYGGTEGQAATVVGGREWLERPGTVGRPVVGQVCILDETLSPVPPGVVGEVFLRPDGPTTYRYIGSEARLAGGGWESLGDMGWMDEDGYLYLGDRASDMILVGGANVYPAEVEGALEEHPDVLSACVVGLPDEDLGSVVHAVVQLRRPLVDSELRAHIASRLASYKWPRSYTRVDTPLRDDSGKVRRSAVRTDLLLSGDSHDDRGDRLSS